MTGLYCWYSYSHLLVLFLIVGHYHKVTANLGSESSSSCISASTILKFIDGFKYKSTRDSTRKNYYVVWKQFNQFFVNLDIKPDNWEDRLILFVGFLISNEKKSTMIKSYISAIKKILRDEGIQINEDKYLLRSLTQACKYSNDRVRTRLPIHKDLLNLLIKRVGDTFLQKGQVTLAILYKAMFTATYYGIL